MSVFLNDRVYRPLVLVTFAFPKVMRDMERHTHLYLSTPDSKYEW